jgi:hypothetical protein
LNADGANALLLEEFTATLYVPVIVILHFLNAQRAINEWTALAESDAVSSYCWGITGLGTPLLHRLSPQESVIIKARDIAIKP